MSGKFYYPAFADVYGLAGSILIVLLIQEAKASELKGWTQLTDEQIRGLIGLNEKDLAEAVKQLQALGCYEEYDDPVRKIKYRRVVIQKAQDLFDAKYPDCATFVEEI